MTLTLKVICGGILCSILEGIVALSAINLNCLKTGFYIGSNYTANHPIDGILSME